MCFQAPGQATAILGEHGCLPAKGYKDKILRVKAGQNHGFGLELEERFMLGR